MQFAWPQLILVLVIAQRLGEVVYSKRNERWLRSQGAIESGVPGTWSIAAAHSLWLAMLLYLVPAEAPVKGVLLAAFIVLQALRLWTLASIGRYWSVRVLTLPRVPLVKRGPYRFLRHPNYLIVMAEILLLPLVFDGWAGRWAFTLGWGALHAALLVWRIRVEEAALRPRRTL